MTVPLTGNDLAFEQLYDVSLHGAEASVAAEARGGYRSNRQPHRPKRFR